MYGGPPPPAYNQPPPGYNPGYNPGPPPYGMPPPPPPQQQTIIVHQQPDQPTIQNITRIGKIDKCSMCGQDTENVLRYKVGGVTIAWCCCLLWLTGVLFWIPFCVDSCKDTQVICQRCQLIKTTIPANCL